MQKCSHTNSTPYYFTFNGFHIFDLVFSVSYSWKSVCFIFLRIYAVAMQNGSNAKFILKIYMLFKMRGFLRKIISMEFSEIKKGGFPVIFNQSKTSHFYYTIVEFFSEKLLICEIIYVDRHSSAVTSAANFLDFTMPVCMTCHTIAVNIALIIEAGQ